MGVGCVLSLGYLHTQAWQSAHPPRTASAGGLCDGWGPVVNCNTLASLAADSKRDVPGKCVDVLET